MRIFAIADSSRRKASPIGILLFDEDETPHIELSSQVTRTELPLSLSCLLGSEQRRTLNAEESRAWIRQRIVPPERQNIGAILRAHGLADYCEAELLACTGGYSSHDDLMVYEIEGADVPGTLPCDDLLHALRQVRTESGIRYELMVFPSGETAAEQQKPDSAAVRIGREIRNARKAAGLSQAELAAKTGVKQSVISGLEAGKGNPTLGMLETVSEALGCQLELGLQHY